MKIISWLMGLLEVGDASVLSMFLRYIDFFYILEYRGCYFLIMLLKNNSNTFQSPTQNLSSITEHQAANRVILSIPSSYNRQHLYYWLYNSRITSDSEHKRNSVCCKKESRKDNFPPSAIRRSLFLVILLQEKKNQMSELTWFVFNQVLASSSWTNKKERTHNFTLV